MHNINEHSSVSIKEYQMTDHESLVFDAALKLFSEKEKVTFGDLTRKTGLGEYEAAIAFNQLVNTGQLKLHRIRFFMH